MKIQFEITTVYSAIFKTAFLIVFKKCSKKLFFYVFNYSLEIMDHVEFKNHGREIIQSIQNR